jgi:hypothetical protein
MANINSSSLVASQVIVQWVCLHNRMPRIKIINACHACGVCKYINIKRKLLDCNASIYFNRVCLENMLYCWLMDTLVILRDLLKFSSGFHLPPFSVIILVSA